MHLCNFIMIFHYIQLFYIQIMSKNNYDFHMPLYLYVHCNHKLLDNQVLHLYNTKEVQIYNKLSLFIIKFLIQNSSISHLSFKYKPVPSILLLITYKLVIIPSSGYLGAFGPPISVFNQPGCIQNTYYFTSFDNTCLK